MNGTTALPSPEAIKGFKGEYQFLSNFWGASVTMDGQTYPSTEHAFQAAKTLNLEDRRRIRMEPKPGRAKRLGRQSELRSDWEEIKVGVMTELVRQKFTTHPELARRLVDTGQAYIEETNAWNDQVWGVCDGEGENKLGEILMKVRSEILTLTEEIG